MLKADRTILFFDEGALFARYNGFFGRRARGIAGGVTASCWLAGRLAECLHYAIEWGLLEALGSFYDCLVVVLFGLSLRERTQSRDCARKCLRVFSLSRSAS